MDVGVLGVVGVVAMDAESRLVTWGDAQIYLGKRTVTVCFQLIPFCIKISSSLGFCRKGGLHYWKPTF